MERAAFVHSIDSIRDFRGALDEFCHEVRAALVDVDLEVRRSSEWLLEQQPAYWQSEVRRREDAANDAKNELHRARMRTLPGGGTPACMEERKALDRAQVRLREAHEKIQLVRQWARRQQHEVGEYEGRAAQLHNLLDGTLPRAFNFLDQAVAQLDAYRSERHEAAPSRVRSSASLQDVQPSAQQEPLNTAAGVQPTPQEGST